MSLSSHDRLRAGVLAFAGVVAVAAVWLLVPEAIRPAARDFPTDAARAANAAQDRSAAAWAARFGVLRGDLWAQAALTYADLAWVEGDAARTHAPEVFDTARSIAETAATAAPHDGRMWLLLARLESRMDWVTRRGASLLRTSYYTAPNDAALVPLRLATFGRLDASGDEDLRQLVRREIANVVNKRPELKGAIVAAYLEALPAGKGFFEDVLRDIDFQQVQKYESGANRISMGRARPHCQGARPERCLPPWWQPRGRARRPGEHQK